MSQVDHYTEGLSLYRQGRYAEALDELSPLCEQEGLLSRVARYYHAMSHRAMGIEALRRGEFHQAEQHLHTVVEAIGRCGDMTDYLASLYAGTARYRQCAEEMEKAVQSDGDSASVWRKLALARWRAGRRCEAYMTLAEAIRRVGEESELRVQLGLFHAAEEQYPEARAELNRAVEADCTNPDAHYYLALAAAAQNDIPAAVSSFQRALELRPDDLVCAYQLAIAAKAAEQAGFGVILRLPELLSQPAGSEIRQLARYVCREPDFVDAFLSLPPSAVDDELFDLLGGVLQMAIDEHPAYADLHYRCSRVFHRLGRTDAAIDYGLRALAINPRYIQALIHVGRLYAETSRPQEAIAHLEAAIACGGDWPDVHCLLGELMGRLDARGKARSHLKRALELNATYTRAAKSLELLAA